MSIKQASNKVSDAFNELLEDMPAMNKHYSREQLNNLEMAIYELMYAVEEANEPKQKQPEG